MIVEIKGTGFVNKGAELMLYSIMEKMRSRYPDVRFVHVPSLQGAPYEKYARLGIYPKASLWRKGIQLMRPVDYVPKKLRDLYGVVINREIDVVLDASGFSYSDQWGDNPSVLMAKACKKWKKQGTKIILLSQAFGPFTYSKIKDSIRAIADCADLIYAREQVSYEHLISVTGERPNIKVAPDFTNLMAGVLPDGYDAADKEICIVPNYRMIDKTSAEVSKAYQPFLENCVNYLVESNQKPFLLIHEGANDLKLAKLIIENTGKNIPIVSETDPLKIKGILGASKGTIGSRFHGLVSALSQGVPALATGWSHKYQMLFQDYDFVDGLLDVLIPQDKLEKKLKFLIDPELRLSLGNNLRQKSTIQKERALSMWDEVFSVVEVCERVWKII
ncbi:polysaccharide pyruvyl transferase family protein [Prosthecochloris sp. ZM_2]|nr:polysaccharide pyruvyl transferase family protein [Prosthecochloris sp. ZM_2]